MKLSRVYKNILSNAIVQTICAISGLILPRFIIEAYGSTLNGMVGSIGQFLMYAGLVEAGVGNAALVALYAPLSRNDVDAINDVLSEAARKYRKTGLMYTVLTCALALIYPVTISDQVDYSFAFFMTIILAMTGMIDYFLIGKYKVLLTADQRFYIINIAKTIATLILTVGSVFLLNLGVSLIVIKGLAVVTHLGEAVFIRLYTLAKYKNISFSTMGKVCFSQQTSSLVHEICRVITYNTDLIVLTLMLPSDSLKEVSVYNVYSLVRLFANNVVNVLYIGINATFGNLYTTGDMANLEKRFKQYEYVFDIFLFVIYSCVMSLVLPFVKCYVGNVTDVNYVRLDVAVLFCAVGLLAQIKSAHDTLVNGGCGMYDKTRKYAIWESSINLGLSLLLVKNMGIVGVLIGTLISHIVMDVGMIGTAWKEVLPGTKKNTIYRITRNMLFSCLVCVAEMRFTMHIGTWKEWFVGAILIAVLNVILISGFNFLCERETVKSLIGEKLLKKTK